MTAIIVQVALAVAVLVSCRVASTPSGQDPAGNIERGRVRLDVTGKSGRIQLYRRQSDNDTRSPEHPVILQVDSLVQRDANGSEVCTGGAVLYSVSSFASQVFSVSNATPGVIPNSGSLPADHISFSTTVQGFTSKITVHVYMVKRAGQVTLDDEVQTLNDGEMKFSVELSNWQWCPTLVADADKYVDVTISIKSKTKPQKAAAKQAKRPTVYDLGNNAKMSLSQKVNVDGAWTDMAEGYPKFEVRGNKNVFTFRLPGFNTNVVYDPTVSAGDEEDDDTSVSPPAAAISCTVIAAMLALLRLL